MTEFSPQTTATLIQAARYLAWGLPPLETRLEKIDDYPAVKHICAGSLPTSPTRAGLDGAARGLLKALAASELNAYGFPLIFNGKTQQVLHREFGEIVPYELAFDEETGLPFRLSFDIDRNPGTKMIEGEPVPTEHIAIDSSDWSMDHVDWVGNLIWFQGIDNDGIGFVYVEGQRCGHASIRIHFSDLEKLRNKKISVQASKKQEATIPSHRSPFVELILKAESHFGEGLLEMQKRDIEEWLQIEGKKIESNFSNNKAKMMATFLRQPELQKGGNKKLS